MEELHVKVTKNIIATSKNAGARLLAVGSAGTLITNGVRNMNTPGFPESYKLLANATANVLAIVLGQKDIPTPVLSPSCAIKLN